MRPNLHIQDYCDVVQLLLESEDSKVADQIFNVGSQNLTINQISIIVKRIVEKQFPDNGEIRIEVTSSNDNRSYHINSDKIKNVLNYVPKYTVENAVLDLCQAFKNQKVIDTNNDIFYNVRRLKRLQIK